MLLQNLFPPRIRLQSLRGKRCLITGAASGIGRATAFAAAREGAELVLTDVNDGPLTTTVAEIRAAGGSVVAARAFDIASFEAVRSFAEEIHAGSGPVDVVMNVAGISVWGTVENLSHEHWRKVVEIDLMGPVHVIESFIPPLIRAGKGGYLVNVSSAAGLFGLPWHAAYSAAKFGLRGISEVLRFDLARHGIGVSLVCPGRVNTGLVDTIEVVGVDRSRAPFQKMTADFRKRAVTPDQAAAAILRGVKKGSYLIFTSRDIAVGHWFQQKLPFLYESGMRALNEHMHRMAASAAAPITADAAYSSAENPNNRR